MKRRTLKILLAAILFMLALGMTLYPIISNYVNERFASGIQTVYEDVIRQTDDALLAETRQRAIAYNEMITPGAAEERFTQVFLAGAQADYGSQLDITGNGTMGFVEIPVLDVLLPIYHGTGQDSLERGAGHLLGSSLPIGGDGTHAILTGHCGMASQKMFTDLDKLVTGDIFYLHVLDETLAYQVDSIRTVLPFDTDLLGIIPGEDLCTLVTCTPYGVNSHRLLVRGSRIPYEKAEKITEKIPEEDRPGSSWMEKYLQGIRYGMLAAAGMLTAGAVWMFLYGKRKKQRCES